MKQNLSQDETKEDKKMSRFAAAKWVLLGFLFWLFALVYCTSFSLHAISEPSTSMCILGVVCLVLFVYATIELMKLAYNFIKHNFNINSKNKK